MTDTGQELSIPPEAAAPAPGTPSLAQVAPPQAPAGIINHRAPLRRLATQAVDLSVLDALGDQSDEEKQQQTEGSIYIKSNSLENETFLQIGNEATSSESTTTTSEF
jgi:hypothetical protein